MSENKKKESVFTKRGFFVALVVAVSLMVIMLVMNLIMPKDASNQLDEEAWNNAVQQSTSNRAEEARTVSASATPKPTPSPATTKETNAASGTAAAAAAAEAETAKPDNAESAAVLLQAPVKGNILKDYSADELVYFPTMQDWRVHEGIDYAVDLGTEVHAAADGTVESVTEDSMLGTGVVLRHADGTQTMYANLEEGTAPEVGKTVKAGETIGKVGQTAALEINDGTHLHFAVMKDNKMMNPRTYLEDLPGSGGGEE